MAKFLTLRKRGILSGLFTNLAAGWFGVVLILPGVTKLSSLGDWLWLTKNLAFGIVALAIAFWISEKP